MDRAEEKQLFSLIDAGTANSTAGDIAVLRADTQTPEIEYREVQQHTQVAASRARWRLFASSLQELLEHQQGD